MLRSHHSSIEETGSGPALKPACNSSFTHFFHRLGDLVVSNSVDKLFWGYLLSVALMCRAALAMGAGVLLVLPKPSLAKQADGRRQSHQSLTRARVTSGRRFVGTEEEISHSNFMLDVATGGLPVSFIG